MTPKKFKKALNRYMAAKANETEQELIEKWYDTFSFPGHAQNNPLENPDKEKILTDKLNQKITQSSASRIYPLYTRQWFKIAASVLLIVSIAFAIRQSGMWNVNDDNSFLTVSTYHSGPKKIILPDSSIVWLNASSSLHYKKAFDNAKRVVYLDEGEAFFEVTKNPKKPFYVHMPKLYTRVLGTSFNIKSYRKLDFTRISVLTGRVLIANDKETFGVFTKDQQLTYNTLTRKTTRESVKSDLSNKWTEGNINLRQAKFNELAQAIKDTYHVDLIANDHSILEYTYTLTLEKSQPLEDILLLINTIHPTKARRHNHEITIYKS